MGFAYAGETGLLAGFTWATLVNYQLARPWFRKPWMHATGMIVGYAAATAAAQWEDEALRRIVNDYERKGYVLPEDRRALFPK